jgi:hypothetical protein
VFVLDVPVTIETGKPDKNVNFYVPRSMFEYRASNDWDVLKRASTSGDDCQKIIEENGDFYKSCGHVMLEV